MIFRARLDLGKGQAVMGLVLLLTLAFTGLGRSLLLAKRRHTQLRIALTFDDLPFAFTRPTPFQEVLQAHKQILDTLARHRAPATGFTIDGELRFSDAQKREVMELWLARGHKLGNHTFSHQPLSKSTLANFEQDVLRGQTLTTELLRAHGESVRYLRLPFLDRGDTPEKMAGLDSFLSEQRLQDAPVTYQNRDWLYSALYQEAQAGGDPLLQARLLDEFVRESERQAAYSEKLNRECFGRQVPLVALLHCNLLNAAQLEGVLTMLEERGYDFIDLDEAMADAAYATPAGFVGSDGLLWQLRWMTTRGQVLDFSSAPNLSPWVNELWLKFQTL